MAEQRVNEARFCLLGVTGLYQKAAAAVPAEVGARFDQLVAAAWPEPLTDANLAQKAAELKAASEEYYPKLARYVQGMDFLQPHDNLSFEQWATYVTKAKQMVPEAEMLGSEYAGKVPPPVLHISPLMQNTQAYATMNLLFKILIADSFADELLKVDILPRALKKAGEKLAEAEGVDNPTFLMMIGEDARELVGYAKFADPTNAEAAALEQKAEAVVARAQALYEKQVEANRMPTDAYRGPGGDELRAALKAAYANKLPEAEILAFAITGDDWVERAEAWSEGDTIQSGVFRYLNAAVAIAGEGDRVQVCLVTFACQWTGRGNDFGAPYLARTRTTYAMLKKNL